MGLSSHPEGGYDKKSQARDIAAVMDKLKIEMAAFVTHDMGNMVGYAFAAQFPARVTRWVVIDAPLPGIDPWDEIIRSPALWHFNFRGPDVERLVRAVSAFTSTGFGMNFPPSQSHQRGNAPSLCAALCTPWRRAFGIQSIRRLHAGCCRQQGVRGQWQACNAHIGARRRSFVRHANGRHHALGSDRCNQRGVIAKSGHWVMEEQPKRTAAAIVDLVEK